MFWAIGAFAVWVLLCNFLLFLSSRRSPAKNFSIFGPAVAAKVSSGDDTEAGCRDGKAADVAANPDARDKVVDGGNGRQEPAEGVGEVERSVLRAASASRYEFSEGKGISGFVEGPKAMSFVVQEMFVDSGETSPWKGKDILIHELLEHSAGEEEEDEDGADQYFDVETFMEMKPNGERDNEFEFVHDEEEGIEDNREEELSFHGDDDNSLEGSQIEYPEGFCRAGLEDEVLGEEDSRSDESQMSPDCEEGENLTVKNSAAVTDQPNLSEDDEYIELELQEQRDLLPENIFKEQEEEEDEQGNLGLGGSSSEFGVQKEPDCSTLDLDSDSDSDSLWEHDDIVEQLKLKLKNVRTGGLPTILEEPESEYESPNTGRSDLKSMPMKTDDKKIENKDRLEEIQKVYKSYAERMKKLDILNSQTLHAIELVQLKDPLRSNGADGRFSVSKVTQNSRKSRWRRHQIDPVMESVGAHYKELKMVYIGQVCLSWEILQWQYGKVQELLASSCSRRAEQYNQVAGELQLFRVLLQRFMEDEPFRGSRVENYARTRCVLKSLLQVPAIKGKKNILFGHPFFASSIMVHFSDDCFKNKKARVRDEDAVSSAGLIILIEESMRVFWDFLHADKHEAYAVRAADQQSADSDLVMSLRTQLQKKDRRLKEISRCKGCILKKLRKEDNEGLHHTLLLARVELRLISRVLKVGRLTRDQVSWCREKMDRINVTDRTIRVKKEPSFLLFPC